MKQHLLLFLTALLSLNCYSQIKFEKGYFIDNDDQKKDVLIRNVDWRSNPSEFEYKLSEDGPSENATIKSVKEFGISDVAKYVRHTVNVDRSSGNVNKLSKNRNPEFNEEEHFLKVLVEGKATLYYLDNGNVMRYFYHKDDSKIIPLIFKKYRTPDNNVVTNDGYKQQLWNDLKCPDFTTKSIERVDYMKKKDMINFFAAYNECHDRNYSVYVEKQKDLYHINLRLGVNYTSLVMDHMISDEKIDFDDEVVLRIGVEGEFILPFHKNKWSIIAEPTYQNLKAEKSQESSDVSGGIQISKIDYKAFDLPIGVRHYFYFNDQSKLFLNLSYVFNFDLNSKAEFLRKDNSVHTTFDFNPAADVAMGMGYKFRDRYGIEVRYSTPRGILAKNTFWSADYQTISLILGYSFF
ncbi:MAG: outer membrane beta-barrel protein [Salinimicrobium sediminis]|nr:outer membrane beta-barrel protein [Salinimicrobium sediminis]